MIGAHLAAVGQDETRRCIGLRQRNGALEADGSRLWKDDQKIVAVALDLGPLCGKVERERLSFLHGNRENLARRRNAQHQVLSGRGCAWRTRRGVLTGIRIVLKTHLGHCGTLPLDNPSSSPSRSPNIS